MSKIAQEGKTLKCGSLFIYKVCLLANGSDGNQISTKPKFLMSNRSGSCKGGGTRRRGGEEMIESWKLKMTLRPLIFYVNEAGW